MFYSQFILAKKGPLGTIWIAAHLERKLRKNQVTDTDIGVSVDSIIFPEVPIALRLSSHLMVGVVRIYSRKVNYLFHDCSEALLKIKQAFRSTAVDLPPEESTAPYHSITLPETFHLDDFELPEAALQGDIDHHVSTKEQITLQDNPERTGYSTSQFGLDERFGDGNSLHIGLDLEEELLLTKDHSAQLESNDGIIIQGRSSVHLTDMDVDDNPSKDENAEGYNMDDGSSSHNKRNPSNADDLVGSNVPHWTGYNVQTPDLNDILLHNEDNAGPSASYYQPSPFPFDEPASPEFVSAQAPATPGLMEETVPSRVHESPVLSPQRKPSPSSNDETAKLDNFAAPPSDFLHSAVANANDAVGAETTDTGKVHNFAAPPSDFLHSVAANANDAVGAETTETGTVDNFAAPPSDFLHSAAANANDAVGAETTEHGLDKPVQVESSAGAVQEIDFLRQQWVTQDLPPQVQTSNWEDTVDKSAINTNDVAASGETVAFKATMEGLPLVVNSSEPCADGFTEPCMIKNPTHFNEGSADVQGYNLLASGALAASADFQQNVEAIPQEMAYNDITSANFQLDVEAIPQEVVYNDRPNYLSTSEFQEREKMLSAPDIEFYQANDMGQITAEKGITESDGSNKIGSLTSRKRHLEDSLPALESVTAEKLSSTPRGERTTDAIPDDNDILASILGGRRTPGLRIDSTPLPLKTSPFKRPRLASKTPKYKRKVQMDDAMVIHADIIRQQLISTEDIRRIRKKAPCTRSEVWMIEKGSLEDDIFREPMFSCMCKELNDLCCRTYETIAHRVVRNMELQGQLDMSETVAADINNLGISGAIDSATLDHFTADINNVGISGANDSTTLDHFTADINHVGISGANDSATLDHFTVDINNSGISGAKDSSTHDHQLHMVLSGGAQLDAALPQVTVATAAFGLQIPSGEHVNSIEGVTESLIGDEKEIPPVDKTNPDTISAQVDTLNEDYQNVPADLQRGMNTDTPLVVLDDITHGSVTGVTDAPDAQAVDDMKGELSDIVHSDVNTFENKEMPASEITGLEFTQNASDFSQPTEDENAVSAMGENSGLQENNAGSFMDLDNTGHDFALKECSDFGSAINGVDTDFLNYDDDVDFDEANDDEPNPDEFQSHDTLSGWSSRTRGVARYLKTLFDQESGLGRKSVAIDHLLNGKTRKEASRMFFETLVLSTKDYIHVEQQNPFDFVNVKPGPKLLKSDF